ncbi:hypothetical protein ACOMHN_006252 [Nucella lapillus]
MAAPATAVSCVHWVSALRQKAEGSTRLVLALVFFTNMLDNLLLTSVVPIIPSFLLHLDKEEYDEEANDTAATLKLTNGSKGHSLVDESLVKHAFSLAAVADSENTRVGWLLSSKAIVQLIANPFVGPLCSRVGYPILLFTGCTIIFLSSIMFAMSETFVPLLLARSVQGLGSAASSIAGMSLVAERYPDDRGRSKAMGIAMGGAAVGILVGYPYGGFMYTFVGKVTPFLVISLLTLLDLDLKRGASLTKCPGGKTPPPYHQTLPGEQSLLHPLCCLGNNPYLIHPLCCLGNSPYSIHPLCCLGNNPYFLPCAAWGTIPTSSPVLPGEQSLRHPLCCLGNNPYVIPCAAWGTVPTSSPVLPGEQSLRHPLCCLGNNPYVIPCAVWGTIPTSSPVLPGKQSLRHPLCCLGNNPYVIPSAAWGIVPTSSPVLPGEQSLRHPLCCLGNSPYVIPCAAWGQRGDRQLKTRPQQQPVRGMLILIIVS